MEILSLLMILFTTKQPQQKVIGVWGDGGFFATSLSICQYLSFVAALIYLNLSTQQRQRNKETKKEKQTKPIN